MLPISLLKDHVVPLQVLLLLYFAIVQKLFIRSKLLQPTCFNPSHIFLLSLFQIFKQISSFFKFEILSLPTYSAAGHCLDVFLENLSYAIWAAARTYTWRRYFLIFCVPLYLFIRLFCFVHASFSVSF